MLNQPSHLTIVYVTYRKEPAFCWFRDSLRRETKGDMTGIQVVVVDWWADLRNEGMPDGFIGTKPKPSVWQGPHRLTREDFFTASSARNTGLCYAPDNPNGWIAYVDDLSVLMPGWLAAVRRAMAENYIVCGAYRKVRDMQVVNGLLTSCNEFPEGQDSRWLHGSDNDAVLGSGSWLYGCSCAMPVEALLKINGWPEDLCDGCGGEDYLAGMAMEKHGYTFRYDRRMLTYESEEHHHIEKPLKRADYGLSPNDKSHAALKQAIGMGEGYRFTQSFGDIGDLRAKILAGGEFPIPTKPTHEWFTGIPLGELP